VAQYAITLGTPDSGNQTRSIHQRRQEYPKLPGLHHPEFRQMIQHRRQRAVGCVVDGGSTVQVLLYTIDYW